METTLEHILISRYKEGMISYLEKHPEDFDEAIKLAVSDKQPYSWRAAWLLWSCMGENDARIQKYVKIIVDCLPNKENGHQRELIKILLRMKLNDKQEGMLFDICMSVWEKINRTPSVRYTAFKFILESAKKHTELAKEIIYLTQDHYMDSLSPGAKKSITKMINEFYRRQTKRTKVFGKF